jgi:hypothetical protein
VNFDDMFLFDGLKLTREPTLLIGMDVFIIDYKTHELYFRTRMHSFGCGVLGCRSRSAPS